jgi:hypothetical protein
MTFKITPGEPIIPSESINATASTTASPASIHGLDFFVFMTFRLARNTNDKYFERLPNFAN